MRRRLAKAFAWNGSTWVQTNEVRYVYDGNLPVQERNANNLPTVTYTRGTDLSGTLQGAGGIGGLLARTDNSKQLLSDSLATAFYHADGNGNVTCLIYTNQILAAKYLYDPFGNTLAQCGALAEANTCRFSSKEWNQNSGLYYYLYRFYDPNLQRWVNRDPIEELLAGMVNRKYLRLQAHAGWNLYEFNYNSSIFIIDSYGGLPHSITHGGSIILTWIGFGGRCCNRSANDTYYVDDGDWHKLPAGQCTGFFTDCDGMMCGGTFYAVSTIQSAECNGDGTCQNNHNNPNPVSPPLGIPDAGPLPGPTPMPLPNPCAPKPLPGDYKWQ
jgi:RHS repeat-associated protein